MPVWVWQPETETAPAGLCLQYGTGGVQPTGLSRSTAPDPRHLIRRCAALSDVMAHPDQHIRRMARWLARAAARRKTGPGRPDPFSIGFAPGASKHQKRRDPERQEMLSWLDRLAREAVDRGASP